METNRKVPITFNNLRKKKIMNRKASLQDQSTTLLTLKLRQAELEQPTAVKSKKSPSMTRTKGDTSERAATSRSRSSKQDQSLNLNLRMVPISEFNPMMDRVFAP